MNNKPVYLTAEGLEKLKSELQHLVTVERPRVAARMGRTASRSSDPLRPPPAKAGSATSPRSGPP